MAAAPPGSCKSKQGENEADAGREASCYSALLNRSARGGLKFCLTLLRCCRHMKDTTNAAVREVDSSRTAT